MLTKIQKFSTKWDCPNRERLYSAVSEWWEITGKLSPGWPERSICSRINKNRNTGQHNTTERKVWFSEQINVACELAVKQPLAGIQLLLRTETGFRCAGYALTIENNTEWQNQSKRKIYVPWHFDRSFFYLSNSKSHHTRKISWILIWHSSSPHTFIGK